MLQGNRPGGERRFVTLEAAVDTDATANIEDRLAITGPEWVRLIPIRPVRPLRNPDLHITRLRYRLGRRKRILQVRERTSP